MSLYRGQPSKNRETAAAFARYHEARHCTLTSSGSASLLCALEAAGVGAGDEVIVPGLTWVASASAILNANAIPVFADIDRETLCISPASIRDAITERTRAILVVHLYAAVADMQAIMEIATRAGLVVIEDCAQAHGAILDGKKVGTFGALGCFSFHQSKVLTCGEGGAVITDDPALHRRVEQLRADGRVMVDAPVAGQPEWIAGGEMMGTNFCLSELQAAVLLGQLEVLDEQLARRSDNAAHLDRLLASTAVARPQPTRVGNTRRSYYHYAVRIEPAAFEGIPIERIASALSAELGARVFPIYPPLTQTPLYAPRTRKRFQLGDDHVERLSRTFSLPACIEAAQCHVAFHHALLLGSRQDMGDIAEAIDKVHRHRDELRGTAKR